MIYEYECRTCGALTTASRTVDDRHNCPGCSKCGQETRKIISRRVTLQTWHLHEQDEWREPLSRTDLLNEMNAADKRYEAGFAPSDNVLDWIESPSQAAETSERESWEAARL